MTRNGPPAPTELGGYRLGSLLGEGGMGAVYRATDAAGAEVVLKLIHPKFAGHGSAAARFAREASITLALSHPAIVQVLASDIDGPQPFIAMEYVPGRTLGAIIRDEGPLGLRRAAGLVEQLLSALAHAHGHGVVHRDLKPANVMVTETADGQEVVRVLDFGIAGLFDDARRTRLTQTGQVLGTPGYLSPEQAQGLQVDGRADLWAVAVMLYAMLAQRLPFPGETASDRIIAMLTGPAIPIREFRPDLPPAVFAVLDRMLTMDPSHRYQTATEAALAITESVPRDWVDVPVAPVTATAGEVHETRQARDGDGDGAGVIPAPHPGAVGAPAHTWAAPEPIARGATRESQPRPAAAAGEGPVPFRSTPRFLLGILLVSLAMGGAIAGAFVFGAAPPPDSGAGAAGGGTARGPGPTIDPVDPVDPVVPVDPVRLEDAPPSSDAPPAGASTSAEGQPPPPASPASPAEPSRGSPAPAASRRTPAAAPAPEAPPPTAAAPTGGEAPDGTCPLGAGPPIGGYGRIVSEPHVNPGRAFAAIRPAFYIQEGVDCLRGVRPESFSLALETTADNEIESVRFTDPGPLTPRMQACLRARMIWVSQWHHIPGPGSIEMRGIRLECF